MFKCNYIVRDKSFFFSSFRCTILNQRIYINHANTKSISNMWNIWMSLMNIMPFSDQFTSRQSNVFWVKSLWEKGFLRFLAVEKESIATCYIFSCKTNKLNQNITGYFHLKYFKISSSNLKYIIDLAKVVLIYVWNVILINHLELSQITIKNYWNEEFLVLYIFGK